MILFFLSYIFSKDTIYNKIKELTKFKNELKEKHELLVYLLFAEGVHACGGVCVSVHTEFRGQGWVWYLSALPLFFKRELNK